MAELIQREDSLNTGREKINEAIKASDRAEDKADYAVDTANQALNKSESTQTQLDTIVIDGDSSVEAAQARVDEKGIVHPTLKARIDDGMNSVNSQLEQASVDSEGNPHETLKERLDFEQTKVWDEFDLRGINIKWFTHLIPNIEDEPNEWDWTPAIQGAINQAQKNGTPSFSGSQYPDKSYGSIVYIPRGFYNITGKLTVEGSGVILVGETKFASVLQYTGSEISNSESIINFLGDSSTRLRNNGVKNLTLRAINDGDNQNKPKGIRFNHVSSWMLENVDIFFMNQAFHTSNAWVGKITGCEFKHNYRSAYLDNASHNVQINTTAFGNTQKGYNDNAINAQLSIRNSWGVRVDACDFEFGPVSIYLFNSVRGMSIENNYFENNTNYSVYIRDESSASNSACEGVNITGNFINNPNGRGIYIRHNNPNGKKHTGINVIGNYAIIQSDDYFIMESTNANPVVENSTFENNSVEQGMGEYRYNSNSGWNIRTVNKIIAENDGSKIPTNTSKFTDNVISVYDGVRLPYQSVPLSLSNDRNLRDGHIYLVSILLSESNNNQYNSLHLVSYRGSSTQIIDISPLTSGSLTLEGGLLTYEKTAGFSCGVEMTIIPIG